MFMRGRGYWPDGLPGYVRGGTHPGRHGPPLCSPLRVRQPGDRGTHVQEGRIAPQMERIAPPSTGIMAPVM